MPPFTLQPPSPIPEPTPAPQHEGMDPQTKNVILFAIIFSVLAAGVLGYIFFKPERKSEMSTGMATTTAASTATPVPTPQKKSLFSLFSLPRFNLFSPPKNASTLFGTTDSNTKTATVPAKQTTQPAPNTSVTPKTVTPPPPNTPSNVPTKELVGIYQEPASAEDQLELQFYAIDLPSSPLRGKIWISSVKRSTKAEQEYVVLSTNKDLPAQTQLTGMTLKSIVTGQIVQVGKGVSLPFPNETNTAIDIKIDPGQKVTISTGRSPVGYSFRLNLCTGYFEQFQNFTPALPLACPLLKSVSRPAPPNHLQDACIDYIGRVGKCVIVTALPKATADALNDEQEYRCLKFVQDNTGYQRCVETHMHDTNFFNPEWRTYLNWSTPIWKAKREIIWLLDQNGDFISQYSY